MAPRKSVKVINNNVNYNNLKINDVICPICRSILIEPVTLPCNHNFCLSCFDGSMENATLTCPLCRLRIGSFLRSAKKANSLINVSFWAAIKHKFSQQVENKVNGIDEKLLEDEPIRVASKGEIRQEYESQRKKHEEELKRQRDAEEKASEVLIKQLRQEEEIVKKAEEEKLKRDEEIAKKLAEEMDANVQAEKNKSEPERRTDRPGPACSKNHNKNLPKQPPAPLPPPKRGTLEAFFTVKQKSVPKKTSSLSSSSSSSIFSPSSSSASSSSSSTSSTSAAFPRVTNTFATKEFTIKELCQNNKRIYQNKLQQTPLKLIKIHALNEPSTSDSTKDSIGPECRHFKPIKPEVPTSSKPFVQVPALRATATTVIICAPLNCKELIFRPEISAFVRLRIEMSTVQCEELETQVATAEDNGREAKMEKEHRKSNFQKKDTSPCSSGSKSGSATDNNCSKRKRKTTDIDCDLVKKRKLSPCNSPPFLGFNSNSREMLDSVKTPTPVALKTKFNGFKAVLDVKNTTINNNKKDNNNVDSFVPKTLDDNDKKSMKIQEQLDFEIARKLHDELNNSRNRSYVTKTMTNTIQTTPRILRSPHKRQATLDDLIVTKI